ncbi:MAG TPA: phosphotransferase family protein [Baekduia sp.]|nr:phosphotransferase family protein [Baekduia sp.]
MSAPTAEDDVVADRAAAEHAARPPLIVLDVVTAFLDRHGIGTGPVRAEPIGDGHSNVTYMLQRDDVAVVLRRPPRPPLPPSTHDVLREARILTGLGAAGARVPKVLATCDDDALLGVPFFVMEHVDGAVVAERLPPGLDSAAARADLADEVVDALVELHALDPDAAGLGDLGRPTGYLARQVGVFSKLWASVRTRDVPEVDRVARWLGDHVPASARTSLVHGDFRLGNLLVHRERPEVVAILDWEMATLGDPLADLGYLCATWARPDEPENAMTRLSAVTRQPGFPSPEQLAASYSRASGAAVGDLRFYEVLALFKAAVFLESSHRRYREGRTDDPYFADLDRGVPQLAREALARTTRTSS